MLMMSNGFVEAIYDSSSTRRLGWQRAKHEGYGLFIAESCCFNLIKTNVPKKIIFEQII